MAESKKILKIAKGEMKDNAVWFMRQAGRYLPEYESIKKGKTFNDLLQDPKTISRISSLPLNYLDVDAVVVFTDILLPFTKMGYRVSYEGGISLTREFTDNLDYYSPLSRGLRIVAEEHREKTIIGVVGGPFTTLSYLFDGGRDGYHKTKIAISSGELKILSELTEEIIQFAKIQVESGADLIQIFDSWLGGVSESYYENHLEKNEKYFVEKIRELGKPVIFFSEGASHLYPRLNDINADVYSIDWRMSFEKFKEICPDCIVQGNLDPNLLGADEKYLANETTRIMRGGRLFRGHVFNLGHGVQPWTDWRRLAMIARQVHDFEG